MKGVPDSNRAKIWMVASGAVNDLASAPGRYMCMCVCVRVMNVWVRDRMFDFKGVQYMFRIETGTASHLFYAYILFDFI